MHFLFITYLLRVPWNSTIIYKFKFLYSILLYQVFTFLCCVAYSQNNERPTNRKDVRYVLNLVIWSAGYN